MEKAMFTLRPPSILLLGPGGVLAEQLKEFCARNLDQEVLEFNGTEESALASIFQNANIQTIFLLRDSRLLTPGVASSDQQLQSMIEIHTLLSNLSKINRKKGLRPKVIHRSSIEVYNDQGQIFPLSEWGACKLAEENMGRLFPGLDFVSLRLGELLQPSPDFQDSLILSMLQSLLGNRMFECWAAPNDNLAYLTIDDAISALLFVSDRVDEFLSRPPLHAISFQLSVRELADACKSELGTGVIVYPRQALRIQRKMPALPPEQDLAGYSWRPKGDFKLTLRNNLVPNCRILFGQPEGTNYIEPLQAVG